MAGSGVGDHAGNSGGKAGWGASVGQGVAASRHSPVTVLSVFWVQVLLGASFLLGATLICAYCRCQPCRPVVPGKSIHALHACITRGLG